MPVCEICDSSDFSVIATEIREGPSVISRCGQCGLVIQDITQNRVELERYYNEEYQKTNSLVVGREQTPREHFEDRIKAIDGIMEKLRPHLKADMNILEVGCGSGELLHLIKPHVKNVIGVEMHKGFVDFMNNDLGIEAHAQDVNLIDFHGRTFDLIISIMTLDHLPNPAETLLTMKHLLSEDGTMYIELPNREEALNYFLPEPNRGRFNKFFWHRGHYFYFTKETLERLMLKTGLQCEIACRHEYTLFNFLNWYFTGNPQRSFVLATTGKSFFQGDSAFETAMNGMFEEMEGRFHKILADTFRGDTLCCVARHERS
jgi:2-polyprenyl-3-methyl-5-hydroxy-6-metoxy-1,4-benzoquinol methylase